jgi:hypothetical protein
MDASLARELFDYDPETGLLTWRVDRPQRIKAGMIAGSMHKAGYIRVKVHGKSYGVHRVIFLWVTGRWPKVDVDHEDLNKANNRWKNLREATLAQNRYNRVVRRDSKIGFKGVVRKAPNPENGNYHEMFYARVKSNGEVFYGAYRRTPEEAHADHEQLARRLHLQFARSE